MPAAGHGPGPLGLQVIGFPPWGRAVPCQRDGSQRYSTNS